MIYVLLLILLICAAALIAWRKLFRRGVVQAGTIGLLYRDGRLQRELPPGYYRWFDSGGRTKLWRLPTAPVALSAYELTLMSQDQFSFRMTLVPVVEITHPQAYVEHLAGQDALWQTGSIHFPALQAQLAALVRVHVAQLTLDEFLAQTDAGLTTLHADLASALPGAVLKQLLVTAIIMPPEVRKMFTEVERARREGMAALERARAETASLRALANAARTMQGNPQLAQLRTLQAVAGSKGAKTFVLGSLPVAVSSGEAALPVVE